MTSAKQNVVSNEASLFSTPLSRRLVVAGMAGLGSAALIGLPQTGILAPASHVAYAETSASVKAQAKAAAEKMNQWQDELDQASDDYYAASSDAQTAQANMKVANQKLDAATAIVNSTQSELAERATTMYKQGPFSFLEVLLGATSFESFTSTWSLLSGINDQNSDLIAQNQTAKADAADAFATYQAQNQVAEQKMATAKALKDKATTLSAQFKKQYESLNAKAKRLLQQEQQAAAEAAQRASSGSSSSVTYTPAADVPAGGYSSVVAAAYSRVQAHCPYVWGAAGPNAFDCSGLVIWSYAQAHVRSGLPHNSGALYSCASARIPISDAKAGDVLWKPGHVAIFVSGSTYIEAPQPGEDVHETSWNIGRFHCALRF